MARARSGQALRRGEVQDHLDAERRRGNDGKFHVAYLATTPGTFFARAEYGTKPTAESNKQRFSVK